MDILEVMKSRHSVRQYLDKKIETEKREILNALKDECNSEGDLNIQIVYDEPKCFGALFSKIMRFKDCSNYIVMVGKAADEKLDQKVGYYGEKLVIKAQELGLNTCWVGLTHGKIKAEIKKDEKMVIVIALGYGENQGVAHKNREISEISNVVENMPDWYKKGIEAALLAPTAVNQQKFFFELDGDKVTLKPLKGTLNYVDAGIVKYHFEAVTSKNVEIL